VGPQRAFGDLQFQRPVGHAIVVHDLAAPPARTGSRRD
jgi:hypothetical protein